MTSVRVDSRIPKAEFGRTGHLSTRVLFGAAALSKMNQDRADATIELMADAGINHIDTAASYGESELRLAPWLADHRDEVFLASKTGLRGGEEARTQLESSLERLGVEQIDLIQLHNLVEDDEFAQAHRAGGAVEAMAKARDEGLVRFIGVTGHGTRIPGMHLRSLGEFDFDSVLFPYNFSLLDNPAYRADVQELLRLCAERNVATQTIKAIAKGRWPLAPGQRFSWYEPIDDADARANAIRYVLGHRQLFLNTTSDARLLPHVLDVAASADIGAPSDEQMVADQTAQGITPLFDGGALERI
jgi:aryl-alcohol dehydrogenase-like predicted oxidoreductase